MLLGLGTAAPALAQTPAAKPAPAPARQAAPSVALPSPLVTTQLIASMLTAVDHANKTGNYTVLLALGSPGFQSANNPARLGAAFSDFRTRQIDLAEVLILSPTFEIPPTMVQPNLMRMRGLFQLTQGQFGFDMQFRFDRGWRLDSIYLRPPGASAPAARTAPAPKPQTPAIPR